MTLSIVSVYVQGSLDILMVYLVGYMFIFKVA